MSLEYLTTLRDMWCHHCTGGGGLASMGVLIGYQMGTRKLEVGAKATPLLYTREVVAICHNIISEQLSHYKLMCLPTLKSNSSDILGT